MSILQGIGILTAPIWIALAGAAVIAIVQLVVASVALVLSDRRARRQPSPTSRWI